MKSHLLLRPMRHHLSRRKKGPGESTWNFVFGQPSGRVAVYSLARYVPSFPADQPDVVDEKTYALLRYRGCRVLTHETGHLFGIAHCIYYRCGMNGSNSLEESNRRPMWCCPVCLDKLRLSIQFHVIARYEKLADRCARLGWEDDGEWLRKRIGSLRGP